MKGREYKFPVIIAITCTCIFFFAGPWFVAEIIEGHTGVVFIWGMYVKGSFLPGSLTYIYGVFQVIVMKKLLNKFL